MTEKSASWLGEGPMDIMMRCLEPEPEYRAVIEEVRGHWWLEGALEYGRSDREEV